MQQPWGLLIWRRNGFKFQHGILCNGVLYLVIMVFNDSQFVKTKSVRHAGEIWKQGKIQVILSFLRIFFLARHFPYWNIYFLLITDRKNRIERRCKEQAICYLFYLKPFYIYAGASPFRPSSWSCSQHTKRLTQISCSWDHWTHFAAQKPTSLDHTTWHSESTS